MRKINALLISLIILTSSFNIPYADAPKKNKIEPLRLEDDIIGKPDGSFEFNTTNNDRVLVSYDVSPKLKMERWGSEAYMEITANFTNAQPDIQLDKIRAEDSDFEVLIYPLPISNLFEYGAVEYEIILKKKPSKNYLTMPIETKNLVYHYQPLVLADKDDEYRDERFAGSYAVYHKYKRDNEFRTGKAFHILRPLLIDSLGNETYANILLDSNILKITMNQAWLDKAVYPVIIDPTFGITAIGAVNSVLDPQRLWAQNSSLTEPGSVTKISFYLSQATVAGALKFAIYENNATNWPDTFIDNSSIIEHPLGVGWRNATLTEFLTTDLYWLAFWMNDTFAGARGATDAVNNASVFGGANPWNGFPDPFPSNSRQNLQWSIFATYTSVPETFYLTSLFHTGISSIDVNGTSTGNLTETAVNDTELALGVANAASGYSFLYWDNENVSHIHDITVTKTMSQNTTITAYAIAVGGGGVSGVSMLVLAVVGGFGLIVVAVASRKR